jgi:ERCC4-type nuclease
LNSVIHRVKAGEFGSLVRPVTVVTSSRNRHHALLEQIPKVGRTTGKKIYDHYDSLIDFVNNWEANPALGQHTKAYEEILKFLQTDWITIESKTITSLGVNN